MMWWWLLGCPKPVVSNIDPDLPEQQDAVVERTPVQVLEAGAADPNPGPRAKALATLVRTGDASTWGPRGLWDPDGWVQRETALALVEVGANELLEEWLARPTAEPHARAAAAVRMGGEADRAVLVGALDAETAAWRRGPLALAAVVAGEEPALEVLVAVLSRGNVALEPDFLRDLSLAPQRAPVVEALAEGQDWVEDELALAFAATRVALGDRKGHGVLRRALDADGIGTRLEAVQWAEELQDEALIQRARGSSDELVAARGTAAWVVVGGKTDALESLLANASPEVRAFAVRAAAKRIESTSAKRERARLEDVLARGLADGHAEVRRAALEAKDGLSLDAVDALLNDAGALNRVLAARYLLAHMR